jgi:hypothetical protein
MLNEIETYFYNFLYDNLDIKIFEQWIYNSKDLNTFLNTEDYFNIISLDFSNKHIRYEIEKIIKNYINYGKFETKLLLNLLYKALSNKNELANILRTFYDMYCHGYYFFQDLGLGYGLTCEVPPVNKYNAQTWEELSEIEKDEIINSFYPQIENDLKRAISWLENKKIILTGKKNEMNYWEFIDNRNDEEKKSTVWVEISKNQETGATVSKNVLWEKKENKKWWKIWEK